MSELPQNPDDSDQVDALYRRASARDAGGPSERVRRAVLDHAAKLAASRAAGMRSAKRQRWWRPAALGTLAAAALAGLVVVPEFLTRHAPISPPSSPAPASSTVEVAQPQAAGPEPRAALREEAPAAHAAKKSAEQGGNISVPNVQSAQDAVQPAARIARSAAAGAASAPSAVSMDRAAQLRQAAERGDIPALRALLDQQPLIDARDADGRTALMLATLHGRAEAVEILLSAGADPNTADLHGTTPLQAALAEHQPAIVAALRRAGAR